MFRCMVTEDLETEREFPGMGGVEELLCETPKARVAVLPSETEFGTDVDIWETDGEILMAAEFPGVEKEAVKITIENDVLSIHGDKKADEE